MTKELLARHEAAHFVMHWATGCPALYVDITEAIQREHKYTRTMGLTFGCDSHPDPFENILISLAGPIGQQWERDNHWIIENERVAIDDFVSVTVANDGNTPHTEDDGDWECCLQQLVRFGIDITERQQLNHALLTFVNATRSILRLCETEWREATDHLVRHGRIGFDGEHDDQGVEAESFFFRWGDEWGRPPENVRECIEGFRVVLNESGDTGK